MWGIQRFVCIQSNILASAKFHRVWQTATPATEFALDRHVAQPCQCDSCKTRNTNNIFCNFSNRHGNILPPRPRVGHRSTWHKEPRLPRETKLRHTRHVHTITHCATFPIGTATFCHNSRAATCPNVPRLPREMKLRNPWSSQKSRLLHLFP